MADPLVYDPTKGLGAIDKILMRGARDLRSMKEISALTGNRVSPEDCWLRIDELTNSRDIYSDAKVRMLVVDELMELKNKLVDASEYNLKDHGQTLLKVITEINKTLTANKFDMKKAMEEISQAQGQMMLRAISLALERSMFELEKRYPEVPAGELKEIYYLALPDVVKQIESQTSV